MSNYQLPEKFRDARSASIELLMLLRSIRDAAAMAELNATTPYGIIKHPADQQREALKIKLLAERISLLATETAWPTSAELLRLDPATAVALMELSDQPES